MFVQVSRQVGRPNFQAGHAGSIPVIRSLKFQLVGMFRLFHQGVNARSGRHVPDDLRRTRYSGAEPPEP